MHLSPRKVKNGGLGMTDELSRNLGFDLVRATEAAALAAGRWMGFGDPDAADRAATAAMVEALNLLDIDGHIVIGEECKIGTHSPLDTGNRVGNRNGPAMDVVVDAIDGARILAKSHPGAMSVIGAAPRGSMLSLYPAAYMEKIIVDREAAASLVPECMNAPAAWTLALIARVKKKNVRDLVVFVLDRPRHAHLIDEIRSAGARILLRSDGDVAGALAAATHSRVDVLMGIGGAPEGLIAACGVKALGGAMVARLAPQSAEERAAVAAAGLDLKRTYTCNDLVAGRDIYFAATGVTDGALLSGVSYQGDEGRTESLVLRCETGSRRVIQAVHTVGG
jgi:fructose-1,6-bisphosphatase II